MLGVTKVQMKCTMAVLFALNFIWLITYLLHNVHFHDATTGMSNRKTLPLSHYSKPWPILPSYLPWSHDNDESLPTPSVGSCEAYFGNGFNETVDLISCEGGSWFRCHYIETLKSSICEGGGIRMNPERINMSKGGENIEDVIGRGDDDELPVFQPGSFQISAVEAGVSQSSRKLVSREFLDKYMAEGEIQRHTMRQLLDSIEVVQESDFQCLEWVDEPTLLLTRFEYANVFHTHTDWYSAYASARVTGLPSRPHVIFLDGHSKTGLEETWKSLFSSLKFAKHFTGPVCLRHAVIVPLGYETALFKGLTENIDCKGASSAHDLWTNPDDHKTARLSEFGEMIKAGFGFPVDRQHNPDPRSGDLNVLFIRREDYLAHPRHDGKVESRLSNEQEVFDSIKSWAFNKNHSDCKIKLVNGLFAHMTMKDQIRAIQDASVIIGAHGAGLTHIVSARPKTVILEIISTKYRRPHFRLIAMWKGLEYNAINLFGSDAEPSEVLDQLKRIIKGIGCSNYENRN